MNQFNTLNKKAARVSNCCFAPVEIIGDVTKFHLCSKCRTNCDTTTFFEELVEQLSNILLGEKIPLDIFIDFSGELVYPANRKITKTLIRKMAANYKNLDIDPSPIRNKLRKYIARTCLKFNMEF